VSGDRGGLMHGKCGLIMGVANDHSIAWGIARELRAAGAELAFTFQGETIERRVRPLAEQLGSDRKHWNALDFVVHAIAFSEKEELRGPYLATSRDNFQRTLVISCYSFTAVARAAAAMMNEGGSLLTLSYLGAQRVTPNYNVMGVAKAALEASVRYLATDLGDQGIRVNAISAGPMRTLAGSAIADARFVFGWNRDHAPLMRNVQLEEVGRSGLYLLSELAAGVTGEVVFVDAGYNTVGIPSPRRLREED
jgi:enoyl-[acyl-carrier protein] reductase I